ncbi:MAG: PilT/PilU family type 4a pilus ATPase [Verrucomicrobiae bacterium]|nr:PilT/PilU family type 4a pilus ATPase [Verrucomicrobiae bacterium]
MLEYLNSVLRFAINMGASDIHIKPDKPPYIRASGQLYPIEIDPPTGQDMAELVEKMLSPGQLAEFRKNLEIDFSYYVPEFGRFRTNAYHQRGQINLAMRYVKAQVPAFDELHLPDILKTISEAERGIVFVSGVTGSGKSTTLAAMIEHINQTEKCHIVTLEDPIEYLFEDAMCLINQREVGLDTKDFHIALRSALRQDPDVILIGEMRDRESFSSALSAADTGHLVFTTVHATNASQTITRVLDFFPADEREQIRRGIASSLKSVISQRLIPSKHGGVVPAIEVLVNTPIVRKLLEEDKLERLGTAIESGAEDGMQSFNQAIYHLIKNDVVTEEEGLLKSTNPEALKMNLQGIFLDEGRRIIDV